MIRIAVLGTALVLGLSPVQAQSFALEFGQSHYFVNPGGTVDVSVFLRENGGSTLLMDEGLFSAGLRLDWGSANAPVRVLSASDLTVNPGFNDFAVGNPLIEVTSTSAGFTAFRDLFAADGVMASPGQPLLLGTFRLKASNLPAVSVVIQASDFAASDDTVTWLSGTTLDGLIASATATITVTPEPSHALFLVTIACGVLWRWRPGSGV